MKALDDAVNLLSRLPGIGKKTAARMAFYVLRSQQDFARALSESILTLKTAVHFCPECGSYTETDPCPICASPVRDRTIICVVEQPQDVLTIETSQEFHGLYHVLGGLIAPLDGVGPDSLTLEHLESRVRKLGIQELIIATNPTVEGDTTALYIKKIFGGSPVKITRLATGMPVGGDLEYADRITLAHSFRGRTSL